MYIVCVCVCALLLRSLVTVSGHLATREFRHQPTCHQETITPATNSPPNKVEVNSCLNESKVVEMKKLFKRSSLACLYACKLHVVGVDVSLINVPLPWASDIKCAHVLSSVEWFSKQRKSRSCFLTFLL